VIQLVNKPVRKLEDLKGLKIRGTARQGDILKALCAVPVPLEMADLYESMRRGVIDGNYGGIQQTKGWRTAEVIKYVSAAWRLGSVYTFYVIMNKDKWNYLPADIKQIFTDVAAEYREKYAVANNDIDIEGRDLCLAKGIEIISLTDAESKRWIKAVEPVVEDYRKDLTSKGYTLAETNDFIAYVRERIEFWRQKEKELGIPTTYK
jgi:TRAP-type C4-dicarboxylate transport system substrate-binding protein